MKLSKSLLIALLAVVPMIAFTQSASAHGRRQNTTSQVHGKKLTQGTKGKKGGKGHHHHKHHKGKNKKSS